MGSKEVKIGLTVILVLLIVFGVVLGRRLMGTGDSPLDSTMAGKDAAASKPGQPPAPKDGGAKDGGPTLSKPRLVAAGASSTKSPKLVSPESNRWTSSPEEKKSGISADSRGKPAMPSFMPDPPRATEGRYPRHGHSNWDSTPGQAGLALPAPSAPGSDPFPRATTRSSSYPDASMQVDATPQLIVPPNQAGPPGYRAGNPGDAPGPGHHGSGRYGDGNSGHGYAHLRGHGAPEMPSYRHSPPAYNVPDPPMRQSAAGQGRFGSSDSPGGGNTEDYRNQGGKYEVQPNDNYWTISQKVYGTGAYFKALAEHNRRRVRNEDQLSVGETISAPSLAQLEQSYANLCPRASRRETVRARASTVSTRAPLGGGRSYTVQEGDTLYDIARNELGKAARWSEIYELNRDTLGSDYNYLTPGLRLTLPDNGPTDVMTHRPGSALQR